MTTRIKDLVEGDSHEPGIVLRWKTSRKTRGIRRRIEIKTMKGTKRSKKMLKRR
jgi:hypothetical protein